MNIILKSFLITLAAVLLVFLMCLIALLPGSYSFIVEGILVFVLLWVYIYVLLK